MHTMSSLFTVFLLCIQMCLLFEFISIVLMDSYIIASVLRLFIYIFFIVLFYVRYKPKYVIDFNYIYFITLIEDISLSLFTSRGGLFNIYTICIIYIPMILISIVVYDQYFLEMITFLMSVIKVENKHHYQCNDTSSIIIDINQEK